MTPKINEYFDLVKKVLDGLSRDEVNNFVDILLKARDEGRTIFTLGNGGSAATASHFVCDFNKGMSYGSDKRFKIICLNDNTPILMAYANDVSFDSVFVEQLKNFLRKEDVVIGISGSGNSENVIRAIDYANSIGATTIGLTGYNGGRLKRKAKYSVNTNIDNMQVTEDVHMLLCHMLYHALKN